MPKYTEQDIVRGKRVTANGMIAGYVKVAGVEKFRIIGAAPGPANAAKRRNSGKRKYTKK